MATDEREERPVHEGGPPQRVSRRGFLRATGFLAGLGAAGVTSYIAYRFIRPAAPLDPPSGVALDDPASYPEGLSFVKDARVFVERRGSRVRCVSAICTHLGCIVTWNEDTGKYECPCHGAEFSADGDAVRGPASRALPVLRLTRDAGGRLFVHRNQVAPRGSEWLDVG